jgi:hypothetical protein
VVRFRHGNCHQVASNAAIGRDHLAIGIGTSAGTGHGAWGGLAWRIAGTTRADSEHAVTADAHVIIAPAGDVACTTAPSTLLKTSSAALWARASSAWIRAR